MDYFSIRNATTNATIIDNATGYANSSFILGISKKKIFELFSFFVYEIAAFFFVCILPCGILVEETKLSRSDQEASLQVGLWNNIKDLIQTFLCPSYVMILSSYVLSWTTVQFVQANLLLYVKYVVMQESRFTMYMLCLLASAAIGGFIWAKLSLWIGKKYTLLLSTTFWILVLSAMFFLGTGTPIYVLILLAIANGFGLGSVMTLPLSFIPDVIDEVFLSSKPLFN